MLTTFAYEVATSVKPKIKRHHFIHVCQATDQGELKYLCVPKMVHYNEQDPLKGIAMKMFKLFRPLLPHSELTEQEAFQLNFGKTPSYELCIVLNDNQRWKIDPTQTRKLSVAVDIDQIVRFECVFNKEIQLDFSRETEEIARIVTTVQDCLAGFARSH